MVRQQGQQWSRQQIADSNTRWDRCERSATRLPGDQCTDLSRCRTDRAQQCEFAGPVRDRDRDRSRDEEADEQQKHPTRRAGHRDQLPAAGRSRRVLDIAAGSTGRHDEARAGQRPADAIGHLRDGRAVVHADCHEVDRAAPLGQTACGRLVDIHARRRIDDGGDRHGASPPVEDGVHAVTHIRPHGRRRVDREGQLIAPVRRDTAERLVWQQHTAPGVAVVPYIGDSKRCAVLGQQRGCERRVRRRVPNTVHGRDAVHDVGAHGCPIGQWHVEILVCRDRLASGDHQVGAGQPMCGNVRPESGLGHHQARGHQDGADEHGAGDRDDFTDTRTEGELHR